MGKLCKRAEAAHELLMLLNPAAKRVQAVLEVFWPEDAKDLKCLYQMGHSNSSYGGCHLACAYLYMVGVHVHRNHNDCGKCATLPCGSYTGGWMILPQCGLVFK
jgi:hypothetical protein